MSGFFGITRGDMPEAPPPAVAAMGIAPGYAVQRMSSAADVDRFCKAWAVAANDAYTRRTIQACVVPSLHALVMPPVGNLDPKVDAAVLAHESAHTQGYVHDSGGRGWIAPAGLLALGQSPAPP